MTQQNYRTFAAMIKSELDEINNHDGLTWLARHQQTIVIAHRMANIFAADNERFKRDVFLKACGLEG